MAIVIHARLEDEAHADAARRELAQRTAEHPSFASVSVARGRLESLDLPDAATETGQNTFRGTLIGAVGGVLLGAGAGASGTIVGLGVGLGVVLGGLFGVLVGMLNGVMAGTRTAKAALVEAAGALGPEQRLLVVEVEDEGQAQWVEAYLRGEAIGADSIARC